MVRVVMSKEQIFADRMKRVCKAARVAFHRTYPYTFSEGNGRREHTFCSVNTKFGFSQLICKRADVSKTQQLAKLLEKEGIVSQVNVVIAPSIYGDGTIEQKAKSSRTSSKQPAKFCTHCGGPWIPDRRGRCKRCGALR